MGIGRNSIQLDLNLFGIISGLDLKCLLFKQRRLDGGLAVPNFKLYFWSFSLRPLINWFNPKAVVSWHVIEEPTSPTFTNISIKQCQLRFGPLISHVIQIWRNSQKSCDILCPWHLESPIFNNNQILIGQRPITFSQWEKKGIHTLGGVNSDTGLRSFQDLKDCYDLPGSSFFFYLQLRAALKAYGVPWGQPLKQHPFYKLVTNRGTSRGFVSTFYSFLLKSSYKDLPLDKQWRSDVPGLRPDFDWDTVWSDILLTSRNPNHQQIHLNYAHRTYLTPRRLHLMGLVADSRCTLCSLGAPGTFLHMFWQCPPVACFWNRVSFHLSYLFSLTIPVSVTTLLLNDFSQLSTPRHQKRLVLADLTAAKKLVAMRWKHLDKLSVNNWILTFLDIIFLELSTARVIGVKESKIDLWVAVAEKLKEWI